MNYQAMKTWKLFLRYVVPQMLGLMVNSVYFIVDGVFIGRILGPGALASAGVAVPVVEFCIALSMMISVGAGVGISAALGRGDGARARQTFNLAAAFTLCFSLVMAALGVIFVRPLAGALGAGEELLGDTAAYLRLFLAFSPFFMFSYALSCWARNDGAPALAMWALVVGSLANIALDWVFMVPFGMGISGAALATGLGSVFSVAILLPRFLRRKGKLYFARFSFTLKGLRGILAAGVPAFASEFTLGFTTLLYNLAIVRAGLGEHGLASYMVIGYAALICLTAFLGVGQGIQPPVSYFAGQGRVARIQSLFGAAMAFGLVLSGIFYLGLYFGGGAFYGIFITNAKQVQATLVLGRQYFLMLPFAAGAILILSFFQAMGKPVPSLAVSLCRSTLPPLVALWVLPAVFGQVGLWLAAACSEATAFAVGLLLWRKNGAVSRAGQRPFFATKKKALTPPR